MATRADRLPFSRQRSRLTATSVERAVSAAVAAGVGAAVVYGWIHRHDRWINPEHGVGYALGIIGGVMMLILLGYPLRKRMRARSKAVGSIGFWFRFHMLLGLIGPLAILYHARFSWGALNSAFALGSMIVVASSGLVGRFFYSRVHRGYSGRKLEVRALKEEMDELLAGFETRGLASAEIVAQLQSFETSAVVAGSNFWSSAAAVAGLGIRTRMAERSLIARLPAAADRRAIAARELMADYFEAVRRAAEFAFYNRLLRLWHLFHLPLFFVLVAAAVLHVVAVHMY